MRREFEVPKGELQKLSGGHTARVTPVPIPNTEVKPRRADDTARVTVWERRSSPGLIYKGRSEQSDRPLCFDKLSSTLRVIHITLTFHRLQSNSSFALLHNRLRERGLMSLRPNGPTQFRLT